jgi:hypothetical protein
MHVMILMVVNYSKGETIIHTVTLNNTIKLTLKVTVIQYLKLQDVYNISLSSFLSINFNQLRSGFKFCCLEVN